MVSPWQAAHHATARVHHHSCKGRRVFGAPSRVLVARRLEDVVSVLTEVERLAMAGHVAVGFVSYDAAPAFDAALVAHRHKTMPLAWFAIYPYDAPDPCERRVPSQSPPLDWRPELSAVAYCEAVDRIRAWIAAGDTYQVNFTFPMRARFDGDASTLFDTLVAAQPTEHGLFIDTGDFAILSVSPESFFCLDEESIVCRPMKGTAPRGLWYEDDEERGRTMQKSEKERAENVMIVDMVRNDLGRIAETGSVHVASLFDTQRLGTCWQMTSTVEARTRASLADIFRALFPSASVTGAPKVRTMQIIRELESAPRAVYCGALGCVGPGRRAEFSVGIRTVTVDREAGEAVYHVGSGITWDSAPHAEFEECRLKAAVLTHRRPPFDLLESLRWDNGYWLLEGHVERLRNSAEYFGMPFDEAAVRAALQACARTLAAPAKVRITLSPSGIIAAESAPLGELAVWRVAVSPVPIDAADVFLYHKTTHRPVYELARAQFPDMDDIIFWNARQELTESTRANLALRFGSEWFTPPIASGLLGGVFRAQLLRDGALRERVLKLNDLDAADELRFINSVRGWIATDGVHPPQPTASRV